MTTLVLGGTGKISRRVIDRLKASSSPVRVGSRSADPPFDWEERATWTPALEGVSAVYLTYCLDLAVPGAAGGCGHSPSWQWQRSAPPGAPVRAGKGWGGVR